MTKSKKKKEKGKKTNRRKKKLLLEISKNENGYIGIAAEISPKISRRINKTFIFWFIKFIAFWFSIFALVSKLFP